MIPFKLVFVEGVRLRSRTFFCMWISNCLVPYNEDYSIKLLLLLSQKSSGHILWSIVSLFLYSVSVTMIFVSILCSCHTSLQISLEVG